MRWESNLERSGWQTETPTAKHYWGLLNNRPSVTWQQVLDKALAGKHKGVLLPATSITCSHVLVALWTPACDAPPETRPLGACTNTRNWHLIAGTEILL